MPKRTMPVKTSCLDLADYGYPGFHADARMNAPPRLIKDYLSYIGGELEDEERARDVLLQMFPSWDFVDDDGKAIPHTPGGFEFIPGDLVLAMLKARNKLLQEAAMPAPLGNGSSTKESAPPTDSPTPKGGSESGQATPSGQ